MATRVKAVSKTEAGRAGRRAGSNICVHGFESGLFYFSESQRQAEKKMVNGLSIFLNKFIGAEARRRIPDRYIYLLAAGAMS